jgi:hypothetical protein
VRRFTLLSAYARKMRFQGLKRMPVAVSGSWDSRRYVTRVTGRDEEFFTWQYEFTFTASDPIRAVFLMSQGGTTRWERAHGSRHSIVGPPEPSLAVPLTFRPLEPMVSDEIGVSLGYAHVRTTSEGLRADPRAVIEPTNAEELFTGEITELATIPGGAPARARILLLDAGDTEGARLHKWRMRHEIRTSAPEELPFLSSGYQTGDVPTSVIEEEQPAS